jgi:hypothetical protein
MPNISMQGGDSSPMAQRALPSSIDNLTRAVSEIEATFYSLQAQLTPVLDDMLTATDVGKGCAVSAPYQYSNQISDLTTRIRALNGLGSDLISRLHV